MGIKWKEKKHLKWNGIEIRDMYHKSMGNVSDLKKSVQVPDFN